jgi:ribosomal protein L21
MGQYILVNPDTGTVKNIDLSAPIIYPALTGDDTIDKELISKYKTKLNARVDNIIALLEDKQISLDQAKTEMAKVQAQIKKTKTAKKVNPYSKLKQISTASSIKLKLPKVSSASFSYKAPILRPSTTLKYKGKTLKLKVDQYKLKQASL